MKRVVMVVMLGACWHEAQHTETLRTVILTTRIESDGLDGAELATAGGWSGIQIQVSGHLQQVTRAMDPNEHLAGGIDLALRASLFGMIAKDHRLDHWFDIGAMGGVGGGLFRPTSRFDSYAQAWGGAWLQIGLYPGAKYGAVFLDVRRVSYRGTVEDATVFGIGLGFVSRSSGYPDIRD